MSITTKQQKFIDEYMVDLNATQAAIRAGYSPKTARQISSKLLTKVDIKAEVAKRMRASRMSSDEVIKRIEGMVTGEIPTKTVVVEADGKKSTREEYDAQGAAEKMGKIYALFIDKQIVENIGLEIIDDDEEE